jgi:hypothetical protein
VAQDKTQDKQPLPLPLSTPRHLPRREVLQGLFAGVSAGVALPGVAGPHPMTPVVAEAQAKAKAPDWKPAFLDAHQMATVTALCARILPGSEKALADRFIDTLLSAESHNQQRRFLSSLGALEGAALARHQKAFRALTPAQQLEVLTAAATAESGRREWIWTPGTPLVEPEKTPEVLTLRDHFDHLKGWVVDAYYSSEAGLKELGHTGQMFFPEFPDCKHESHG